VLPEYLRVMKDYDVLVYGAIVIVAVMWAPSGIAGLARRALARWQSAPVRAEVSA